jgi:5'-deoxynucleotidase YfbR-like HD superfamily hydrolase
MGVLQTFSGKVIDIGKPSPDVVDIMDIAHALSMTCRFGGHCRDFYSVAEHSVHVEEWAMLAQSPEAAATHLVYRIPLTSEQRLQLLLHDAAEAYIGDIVAPLKAELAPRIDELEECWLAAIGERFRLGRLLCDMADFVKRADLGVLTHEAVALFHPLHAFWAANFERPVIENDQIQIGCWSPAEARRRFLHHFRVLQAQRGYDESWPSFDPDQIARLANLIGVGDDVMAEEKP